MKIGTNIFTICANIFKNWLQYICNWRIFSPLPHQSSGDDSRGGGSCPDLVPRSRSPTLRRCVLILKFNYQLLTIEEQFWRKPTTSGQGFLEREPPISWEQLANLRRRDPRALIRRQRETNLDVPGLRASPACRGGGKICIFLHQNQISLTKTTWPVWIYRPVNVLRRPSAPARSVWLTDCYWTRKLRNNPSVTQELIILLSKSDMCTTNMCGEF